MTNATPPRAAGLGDNSWIIEQTINASYANGGFPVIANVPLTDFLDKNGAGLGTTPGSTPYRAYPFTNLMAITWLYSAVATDVVRLPMALPGDFDGTTDRLFFQAAIIKLTPEENAALSFQCQLYQHLPGTINPGLAAASVPSGSDMTLGETALSSLAAPVKRMLPAASTNIETIRWMQWDLSQDMRGTLTDGLKLRNGDTFDLVFGPDGTVGSATTSVSMTRARLVMWKHACLSNRDRRESIKTGGLLSNKWVL